MLLCGIIGHRQGAFRQVELDRHFRKLLLVNSTYVIDSFLKVILGLLKLEVLLYLKLINNIKIID